MAKTVTDDQLTSSIAAVGGLQRMMSSSRPRRDNPFALVEGETPMVSTKSHELGSSSPFAEKRLALTERIDLPLSEATRDELDCLARRLHRGRPRKGKRITSNTLIRVAIRVLLERLDGVDLRVSDELELFAQCRSLLGSKDTVIGSKATASGVTGATCGDDLHGEPVDTVVRTTRGGR